MIRNNPDFGKSEHVGEYVRGNVIPQGLSVTEAAKLLGVGRPALSNFLNGRAKLSSRMAARLERAFGADAQLLLDMQAGIDLDTEGVDGVNVVTGTYAPSILAIRAKQISQWAENIESRSRMAVLIRKLVHSTGVGVARVDFPGYDLSEQPGWDGYVESRGQTPWIPSGASGWELGTGGDAKGKANRDYGSRLQSVSVEERANHSFIFVTPHVWTDKVEWAREKNELGDWLEVRAYDASDLEQWIEQSIPAQVWIAEQLGIPVAGYRSLDECWIRWSKVTEPYLSRSLYDSAKRAHVEKLKNWLGSSPSAPMKIAADSKDEALAFLSCLADDEQPYDESWGSRTVVFDSVEALQKLGLPLPGNLIAVSSSMDVERELASLSRDIHCILVRPRGLVDSEPGITLDRLNRDDFNAALDKMDIRNDAADRLDQESARSLTILRRRLSNLDIIRVPEWAREEHIAKQLAPMALIGAWVRGSRSDQEAAKVLARVSDYESVESDVISLLRLEDSPVWRTGQHRGVVSKLDALFAIGKYITEEQLDDFFLLAEYVLSEVDPSLELPPNQQWAAALYEKEREHSDALRTGICETLALLAAYGVDMFRRPGLEVEHRVDRLVRDLIAPSEKGELLSLHSDLPNLAEAAPGVFLNLVEADLRSDDPALHQLFSAEGDDLFSIHRHTGLLWALERLAWNPENLPRVANILAELHSAELPSNLGNTPIATLRSIFRSWIPQTAATVEQRIKALEYLAKNYPEVGWTLCIGQITLGSDYAVPNVRPRWRSDASGAGYPVMEPERDDFRQNAVRMALEWADHDENTLGDLVDRMEGLTEEEQDTLLDLIEDWTGNSDSDVAKSNLWNRLRLKRRGSVSDEGRLQAAIERLTPTDPVMQHEWMFSWEWDHYPETYMDDVYDFEARDRYILSQRLEALGQIWNARAFEGISTLIEKHPETSHFVGSLIPRVLSGEPETLSAFVRDCIQEGEQDTRSAHAHCLRAVLQATDPADRKRIADSVEVGLGNEALLFLFLCMPFRGATWRLLDHQPEDFRKAYWEKVIPVGFNSEAAELNELIDRLLEVNRPMDAFRSVGPRWPRIETSRLKNLLHAVAAVDSNDYIDQFSLSSAFDALDRRPGVSILEKAGLEFIYALVLERSEHGIPNLDLLVSTSPTVFVELLEAVYGKKPDPENAHQDERVGQAGGMLAFSTLQKIRRTPGTVQEGNINVEELKSWLSEVRALAVERDIAGPSDRQIGQLLSRSATDGDGLWPNRAVCEAMEWMCSENVQEGFILGICNSRGAVVRGRGGDQERELAEKYRAYARRIAYEYPFMASTLNKLADGYESEAKWWDDRAELEDRLPG